jgi:hypothetical protein
MAIMVQREAAATVRQLAEEFGLTLAARVSVEVNTPATRRGKYNPFDGSPFAD